MTQQEITIEELKSDIDKALQIHGDAFNYGYSYEDYQYVSNTVYNVTQTLTAKYEALNSQLDSVQQTNEVMGKRLVQMEQENQRLREVLEPFMHISGALNGLQEIGEIHELNNNSCIWQIQGGGGTWTLLWKHFLAVREALALTNNKTQGNRDEFKRC